MKAKRQEPEPEVEEPAARKYGYKIKLKCHIVPTEIEWTTETTNNKLQTTSIIRKERHTLLPQEMDPT